MGAACHRVFLNISLRLIFHKYGKITRVAGGKPRPDGNSFYPTSICYLHMIRIKSSSISSVHEYPATLVGFNNLIMKHDSIYAILYL
jgi:hypothetical protein